MPLADGLAGDALAVDEHLRDTSGRRLAADQRNLLGPDGEVQDVLLGIQAAGRRR